MPREAIKDCVPDLWKQRAAAGLCPVCGKTAPEFDKGLRVYCSKKCRDEYASKFQFWTEIREKILNRDNHTCQICGLNQKQLDEKEQAEEKKLKLDWIANNKSYVSTLRSKALVELSERYEKDHLRIFDDLKFFNEHVPWEEREKIEFSRRCRGLELHVDHKEALVNGGDMWDENNLRTLCCECHKKKTKVDLLKARNPNNGTLA